ncbi:MAG: metalloregulator ArsR/SmtB family transcription factor [Vicinamibacterales bacterium]|nr:metalloregulator ArsR/SmtB family transcription factor [Vicinamibacterales bacterium]
MATSSAPCCGATPAPRLRHASTLAALCKVLSDETRLRLLALIARGEVCVCELHGSLRLPQPTVSRHLAALRRAGLVAARRDGIWMHYRLADTLDPVTRTTLDAVLHALTHTDTTAKDAARLQAELTQRA